ncbi:serine aminopeptidase, s33 domain-containing protein [Ditylenchus destructor]|uniref:Serine aminopeptidase, s33 domain-containing protein n=1 Tax=Ditylenchus destructor TaxID=166010 RepID=A0AAD4MG39_9BILA|nr:serine aminopeptidase, s33 domain-containing protein [Ditylenchus destructor]
MSLVNLSDKQRSTREEELPLLTYAHDASDSAQFIEKESSKSRRNRRKTETSESNKRNIQQSWRTSRHPTSASCQQSSDNQESFNCLQCCFYSLVCCAIGCWLACPPVPSCVANKIAFRPPRRGKTYGLSCEDADGEMIEVDSACQAYGKEQIRIIPRKNAELIATALSNSNVFVVKTAKKNHLVCVWLSSNIPSDKNVILLMAQPNSCDLGDLVTFRIISDNMGVDAVLFDYSGYGMSSGRATEANIYADIEAVYKFIRQRNSTAHIVLIGISLGTTACVDLASKNPGNVAGVVLVAPLASGCRLLCRKPNKGRSSWLDQFCSIDKVGLIDSPVLLIHGVNDSVISSSHSLALMKKIKNPVEPLYVEDADHNNVLGFPEVFRRLRRFIEKEI